MQTELTISSPTCAHVYVKVDVLKPVHSFPSNSSTIMKLLKALTSPHMPLMPSLNPKSRCSSPEWQCWCQLLLLSSSEPALTPNQPGRPWVCQEFCWNTNEWKTGDISPACYVISRYVGFACAKAQWGNIIRVFTHLSLHLVRQCKLLLQQKLYSLSWVHKSQGLYNSQYPLNSTSHLDTQHSISFMKYMLHRAICWTPWSWNAWSTVGMYSGEVNISPLIMTLLRIKDREHQCLDD